MRSGPFGLIRPLRRRLHRLFDDELLRLGPRQKREARIGFRLLRKEIQEIPLRHERDELGARWQMREIGEYGSMDPNRPLSA